MLFDRSALGLLLDGYRVRRLWRTVGRDLAAYAVEVEADSDRATLTDDPDGTVLLDDPFDSVADVHDRLTRLEATLLEQGDRRAVFATVYTEMTAHTARAIDAGEFRDPAWMEAYLVAFAERYRRAFRDYERGAFEAVPDPWLVAFGTALRGDALVLQDAFLGINAHINYDLALTLTDVGIDPDRLAKYADHSRVNEILRRLVRVQQELLADRYAPGLRRVGDGLGEFDELAATLGLGAAREKAWRVAVVRTDARWLPVERYTEWLLNRTATGGAFLLLQPRTTPAKMQALRDVEADEFDLSTFARAYHERAQFS